MNLIFFRLNSLRKSRLFLLSINLIFMKNKKIISFVFSFALLVIVFLGVNNASAHCDTMDGPVIKAAQEALNAGNPDLVLIWVKDEDDKVIKEAFDKTMRMRKLSPEAREFADMYFFENLVRIHRAGEGAPYTGIKPAGTDIGEIIPAIDKAFETGTADPFLKFLPEGIHNAARNHFNQVYSKNNFDKDDVEAGREYIGNYVQFMHHVLELSGSPETEEHKHSTGTGEEVQGAACPAQADSDKSEESREVEKLKSDLIIAWSTVGISILLLLVLAIKAFRR